MSAELQKLQKEWQNEKRVRAERRKSPLLCCLSWSMWFQRERMYLDISKDVKMKDAQGNDRALAPLPCTQTLVQQSEKGSQQRRRGN